MAQSLTLDALDVYRDEQKMLVMLYGFSGLKDERLFQTSFTNETVDELLHKFVLGDKRLNSAKKMQTVLESCFPGHDIDAFVLEYKTMRTLEAMS